MIDSLINWVAQWIAYITTELTKWVMNLYQEIKVFFVNIVEGLRLYIDEIVHTLVTYVSKVIQFIADVVARMTNSIEQALKTILDKLIEVTIKVVDTIAGYVRDILAQVRAIVAGAVSDIRNAVNAAIDILYTEARVIMQSVRDTVASVKDKIVALVTVAFRKLEDLYDETLKRINVGLEHLIGGADSLVTAIAAKLGDIREGFAKAATDLSIALGGVGKEHIDPIRSVLDEAFKGLMDFADPRETQALIEPMRRISNGEASPQEMRNFISSEWARYVPSSKLWTYTFSILGSIVGILMTFLSLGQAQAQVLLQDYAREFPYQVLNPADVTTAWRRGYVDEEKAVDAIRRQGYDEATSEIILRLSDTVPMEQDLFELWHRGFIEEEKVDAALFQKGYTPEYTTALKEASWLIPPVGDLITMAVREVFTPEVAARFGQYEDFPKDFALWAERTGLTQKWAERYWAAHWALPSAQQGFEMLHRGVIGQDDLNLLLRALDVMPYWRDRLTQVAFRPFTRVDVRRMHKLGILDDDAVKRSYMDLGYDEEKAARMTEFTIAYNAPKKADDDIELGQLTRAAVINFYSDGLLTYDKAYQLMLDLGYSEEGATLYLESADMDNERKERKNEIDLILDLAKANAIDFTTAQDRLRALELSTAEVQRAIADLERNEARKTKLPSRTEAEKMVLAGLIPLDDYRSLLSTLGYAPKWVNAYVSLLGGEFIASQKRKQPS